jgi:hypothetical protein
MKFLPLLAGLFLAACAQTPVVYKNKPGEFGPLSPGGPVFQPVEVLVSEPAPADPPIGNYFANDRAPQPAGMKDPYWVTGYWGWRKDSWDWVPGRWVERPRPGVIWINARYYTTGGQQYWVAGYWE